MGHQVENLLTRLKDWRPTATRTDRCAHVFLSAVPSGRNRHLLVMSSDPGAGRTANLPQVYGVQAGFTVITRVL